MQSNICLLTKLYFYSTFSNLYGCVQTLKIPFSNFEWLCKTDVETLEKSLKYSCRKQREDLPDVDLSDIFPEDQAYYLEVDLEYPRYLNKLEYIV